MDVLRLLGGISTFSSLWMILAVAKLSSGMHLSARAASQCFSLRYISPTAPTTLNSVFSRRIPTFRAFAVSSNDSNDSDDEQLRMEALHNELSKLNVDASALKNANLQAIENPTNGYDGRYGRSAIRAYRSFVQPKSPTNVNKNVQVLAAQAARQIEFLIKRHYAHEAQWIRHADTAKTERQIFPLMILLDNVRSAFNVGSLFRTADASGCSQVITTGITPHPGGSGADKLTKSALGADRVVPSRHFDTTLQAIESLRNDFPEMKLIGLETTEKSLLYSDYEYPKEGVVLILGNEVTGVDTEIIPLLDAVVEIPMFGIKNSLNIASCGPVVLYEVLRQWKVSEEEPVGTVGSS